MLSLTWLFATRLHCMFSIYVPGKVAVTPETAVKDVVVTSILATLGALVFIMGVVLTIVMATRIHSDGSR